MGNKSLSENIILEAKNTQKNEKKMFLKYSSSTSRARKWKFKDDSMVEVKTGRSQGRNS